MKTRNRVNLGARPFALFAVKRSQIVIRLILMYCRGSKGGFVYMSGKEANFFFGKCLGESDSWSNS